MSALQYRLYAPRGRWESCTARIGALGSQMWPTRGCYSQPCHHSQLTGGRRRCCCWSVELPNSSAGNTVLCLPAALGRPAGPLGSHRRLFLTLSQSLPLTKRQLSRVCEKLSFSTPCSKSCQEMGFGNVSWDFCPRAAVMGWNV